ncbi:MAG: hypothetical protein AAF518_11775 [Spirochaetota bacterium]
MNIKKLCLLLIILLSSCQHQQTVDDRQTQKERSRLRKQAVLPNTVLKTPETISYIKNTLRKEKKVYSKKCPEYYKQLSEENAPSYKWAEYKKKCSIPEF